MMALMTRTKDDYLMVPTTKGLQRVRVLAHWTHPETGLKFVLHEELSGNGRMVVTAARTGRALGTVRGLWDTYRNLSDGYTKADLQDFLEAKVREVILKHGQGKLEESLKRLPTVNSNND